MRHRFKPVAPDQRIRELRKQLQALSKQAPSPERARQLAALTRTAHEDRQLNMAMHAAQLCLDDDPDDPSLLVAAYSPPDTLSPEDELRTWSDLQDIARYVGREDVRDTATSRIRETATAWIADADSAETRHRMRTLTSMFGRTFADDIRNGIG